MFLTCKIMPGPYRFEISSTAYSEVLKQAARTFYYQRINFVKQAPYTDVKWADGAAFGGANQDYAARSRYDKTNPATARDLHGGWMDAGDYNKYTTSTFGPPMQFAGNIPDAPCLFYR